MKLEDITLKQWAKAKWLFYLESGMPEVADAYQRDFNLTDKETWSQIDAKTDTLVKKKGWFKSKSEVNRNKRGGSNV